MTSLFRSLRGFAGPALALLLSSTCFAEIPKAPEQYHLVYRVATTNPADRKPESGLLELKEEGGKQFYRVKTDRQFDSFLYFDGKESTYSSTAGHVEITDGFQLGRLSAALYMPFSFHTAETYREVKSTSQLQNIRVNVGIGLTDTFQSAMYYVAGANSDWSELRTPLPTAPTKVYRFRDYFVQDGFRIPKQVDIDLCQQYGTAGIAAKSRVLQTLALTLKEVKVGPQVTSIPPIETIIADGSMITYYGVKGETGVVFDAKKSLSSQLTRGRDIVVNSKGSAPKDQEKSLPWVPTILVLVVATVSTFFLIRANRKKRSS